MQEQISPVCEEIKVQAKTCLLKNPADRSTPRAEPAPFCSPKYLPLVSFRHQRRKMQKRTQKEPSRELLSTSLVLCRSYSLSRIPRFLFIKKRSSFFEGGCTGEARRQAQTSLQEKPEQDFNRRGSIHPPASSPPSFPPPPLSPPSSSLSHTHKLTHTYWIKMGLVARCAMLSKTHRLKKKKHLNKWSLQRVY